MQRPQLEHIIRAAAGITGAQEFIIIGSQAGHQKAATNPGPKPVPGASTQLPEPPDYAWANELLLKARGQMLSEHY